MTIYQNDPYKVGDIRVLKKSNESKAKELLQKVALQVQPLMRTHKFTVPLLTEFSPKQPNLLGLNVGGGNGKTLEIRIRLRPPSSSQDSFYPYEHILGTMLHELTHNVRGPHDALFYEKLDELTAECEELITKGIVGSGQGFDALSAGRIGGRRLVGDDNSSSNSRIHGIESNNGSEQQQQQQQQRQPAKHILREAMMKAAEARARQASLMPSGPRKVGGNPTLKNIMTAREAAVYAAERRLRDNVWCPTEEGLCLEEEDEEDREGGGGSGSGNGNGVNVALQKVLDRDEGIKREKNDKKRILRKGTEKIREKEEEVVVLIDSDDDDGGGGGRQVGESSKKKRSLEASGWACVVCTLVNEPLVLQCMACLTERPPHVCKN